MRDKTAMFVDYQRRAREFAVNDAVVSTLSRGNPIVGRVVAVYPAIGMVDVEWPNGNSREPVETLQRFEKGGIEPPKTENVPGGAGQVLASTGGTRRVAEAFVKKSLYWAAPDRHYKATREECETGKFRCPKCKKAILRPASYQRENGSSERLLACSQCLFLIRHCDIIGHPSYVEDDVVIARKPKRSRLTEGK